MKRDRILSVKKPSIGGFRFRWYRKEKENLFYYTKLTWDDDSIPSSLFEEDQKNPYLTRAYVNIVVNVHYLVVWKLHISWRTRRIIKKIKRGAVVKPSIV